MAGWLAQCRRLCTRAAGSAHVGMLQVFRIELASRPAGSSPRLLFPSGLPSSPAATAAVLAEVAARDEMVLLTEQVLGQLLGLETAVAAPLLQAASSASVEVVKPRGAASGGGCGLEPVSPSSLSRSDLDNVIATADVGIPLSHLLAAAASAAEPDWSRTIQPTHNSAKSSTAPPRGIHKDVLAAAADGNVTRLRTILGRITEDEGRHRTSSDESSSVKLLATARMHPSGASALHLASATGSLEAVDQLLLSGAPVDATATNGSTALHWAAAAGHVDVVKRLLRAGASNEARTSTWCSTVRGNDTGQTPAHWAAATGKAGCLAALLEAGPHTLILRDERGLTPARLAGREGFEGLEHALTRLEDAKVVCVRVEVELSAQSPMPRQAGQDDADHDTMQRRRLR